MWNFFRKSFHLSCERGVKAANCRPPEVNPAGGVRPLFALAERVGLLAEVCSECFGVGTVRLLLGKRNGLPDGDVHFLAVFVYDF